MESFISGKKIAYRKPYTMLSQQVLYKQSLILLINNLYNIRVSKTFMAFSVVP